ncbi:MAG TPA: ATP-binding protein, partial [Candidatus Norongarragalinales archaeon]|nr:ATP-binding protein [Candidatus Norongarragalinales archaeon]
MAETKDVSSVDLEKQFKEYSVAEFFKKNRQMLGYSGKLRSLTTIVHEFVTNSLDSCEETNILPEISVEISELPNGHFRVAVEDNGLGIPKKKVGAALGKLLAGTKFHQRMQKRGQQGIGAAYATLFAQITTGKPTHVKSSIGDGNVYECDITVDVQKNDPSITNEKEYRGKFRG